MKGYFGLIYAIFEFLSSSSTGDTAALAVEEEGELRESRTGPANHVPPSLAKAAGAPAMAKNCKHTKIFHILDIKRSIIVNKGQNVYIF